MKILLSVLLSFGIFLYETDRSHAFSLDNILDLEASSENLSIEDLDPFEPLNRLFFGFNRGMDGLFLKPMAVLYDQSVHPRLKTALERIIETIFMPVTVANHLLQGEGDRAISSLMRGILNAIFGMGGIFDIAHEAGLKSKPTDMNETFASWNIETGPYLMLPFLGPTTFRGAFGKLGDWGINPWTHVVAQKKHHQIRWRNRLYGVYALDLIQQRAFLRDVLDDIEKTSSDPYVTIRSAFFQKQSVLEERVRRTEAPKPCRERNLSDGVSGTVYQSST